jgi:UDP-GlcNAc3NAcA epimerase
MGTDADHRIIHTGQHYDARMSDIFFSELGLPTAAVNLGVGSGSHGNQTGTMLIELERTLRELSPDLVVVYGDTNSTLAGTLAATKLHIPVAHVEAGLRSFNRQMPEEINRVVADHVCDLLLAPTPVAIANLRVEGLGGRSVFTGDVMYDAVLFFRALAQQRSTALERFSLRPGAYAVATLHRAENTDDSMRLQALLTAFNDVAAHHLPVIFPIHPRTARQIKIDLPDWRPHSKLHLVEPVGYLDMLVDHAAMALTDSGGLQKEAFFLGCPCVTLRDETEWEETVRSGANVIVGADSSAIQNVVADWRDRYPEGKADFSLAVRAAFGEGHAAEAICQALIDFLQNPDEANASMQSISRAAQFHRLAS